MRPSRRMVAIAALGAILGLGLTALVLTLGAGSSEAQQGTMHNCPPAGMWAMSVWIGDDGMDTEQALATCGEEAAVAAYYLDPETQVWWRWFAGRPQVSSLATVNDKQGVLALGRAQVQATPVPGLPNPASVYCVELGYELRIVDADGQVGMCVFPDDTQCEEWSFFQGECGQGWAPETMHNCPQPGKWAISVWSGTDNTETGQALTVCGAGAVDVAYYLDLDTQQWSRWFAGRPEVSDLATLKDLQGVLALGGAPATQTPSPTPTPTPGAG